MKRLGYALSTFMFNFFEMGVFIHVLLHWGLTHAMLVGLASKIGKGLHETWHVGSTKQWSLALIIVLVIGVLFSDQFVVVCIISALIDLALMKLRVLYKKRLNSRKTQKVVVRMLAFFLAPFFTFWAMGLFIIPLAVDIIRCDGSEREGFPGFFLPQDKRFVRHYWLMFMHHAHYFSYCYIVLFLLINRFHMALPLVGILFFIGWSAYNIYEPFVPARAIYFFAGHIIAAFGVATIWLSGNNLFLCLFGWFATGLGGGTVYMIKDFMRGVQPIHLSSSKTVESYGHVLGLLISLIGSLANSVEVMYGAGITFAIITAALSLFLPKEESVYVGN